MLVAGGLVTCESIVLYMNIGEPVIQRWFHTDRGGGGGVSSLLLSTDSGEEKQLRRFAWIQLSTYNNGTCL